MHKRGEPGLDTGDTQLGTAIVVTHVRTPFLGEQTTLYATRHFSRVLEISHQLIHTTPARSTWRLHEHGRVIAEGQASSNLPEAVRFVYDVILTVWWSARRARKAHVYVGLGVLNGAAGLLVRALGIARSTRCWLIDYTPQRFPAPIMNSVFHAIESLVAWRSDQTWNITEEIFTHNEQAPFPVWLRRKSNKQKIVPVGVEHLADGSEQRMEDRIVFVGHILEKQGVHLVIDALPQIRSRRPHAHLVVIGDGPYLRDLKERTAQLHLQDAVEFRGLVESDEEVWSILTTASIGVAPYLNLQESFTKYADPAKVKTYASAGLPVCMTAVPSMATIIVEAGFGVITDDHVDAVRDGIIGLLSDPEIEQRRAKAVCFASHFAWNQIFDAAFDVTSSIEDQHSVSWV